MVLLVIHFCLVLPPCCWELEGSCSAFDYKHVREGRAKKENRESREDKEEEGGGGIPYCYL